MTGYKWPDSSLKDSLNLRFKEYEPRDQLKGLRLIDQLYSY